MPTSPILDVIELYAYRGGDLLEDSSHTGERGYHVKTVSGLTDTARVLRAGNEGMGGPRIPQRGEHYQAPDGTFDFTLRVKDIRARPNAAHDLWLVQVFYINRYTSAELSRLGAPSPPGDPPPPGSDDAIVPGLDTGNPFPAIGPPGEGGGGLSVVENPLLRPARVSFHGVKTRVVVDKHRASFTAGDGGAAGDEPQLDDAVLNSAGDPFDPPYETDEAYLGATITVNRASFQAQDIKRFSGSINESAWRGQPARSVRCTDLKADQAMENGVWHWVVTAQLEFAPAGETWNPRKVLDRGKWHWQAGVRRTDIDGVGRPAGGVLLNGAGAKLTLTVPPADPAVPIYRNVYPFREEDWDTFPV
jgi:hypothetical protein